MAMAAIELGHMLTQMVLMCSLMYVLIHVPVSQETTGHLKEMSIQILGGKEARTGISRNIKTERVLAAMFLNNLKYHEFGFVKVLICSITMALLLGGGGGYRWINSEKNISHFDKDSTQCQAYAFEKFPPNIIQQLQYKPVYNPQAMILARQGSSLLAN
ncbi:MAG: hypothetical protein K2Q34_05700 [Alphaproteobacteria bacterium]|nr:hypothetical protein [Alphaproteobacteria bacterium]